MSKIETHLHTAECDKCAHVSAKDIVHLYKNAGYDCIVVTDHSISLFFDWFGDELQGKSHKEIIHRWLKGYYTAREEGEKIGVTVLPGAEVRFDGTINDYLVYGLEEDFFYNAPLLNTLKTPEELIKILPSSACVVQAHPFREADYIPNPGVLPHECLDGVEVFNRGNNAPEMNQKALDFACEHNLIKTSSADAHWPNHIPYGGITTEKRITNEKELADLLRSGEYELIIPD